jgi:hypothetical protein
MGRSPRRRSGHHSDAARRRRAHLAVNARAGEGARRGAARSEPPAVALARVGGKKKTPGERREEYARVSGRSGSLGVLIRRDQRATVDRDRTIAVVPRVCGPLLAQARRRFPGPGPGCGLVRGSAPHTRVVARVLGWAALGRDGLDHMYSSLYQLSNFSETLLHISCMVFISILFLTNVINSIER